MDVDLRDEMSPVKGILIGLLICTPLWVLAGFGCYYKVHSWIAG